MWGPSRLALAVLTLITFNAAAQTAKVPEFAVREVTLIKPETDTDEYSTFPKGPATVCIEAPPQRQCYTAPDKFGLRPMVKLVQIKKDTPALLFSADTGGISDFTIHLALLQPADKGHLQDHVDVSISNQSQYAIWKDTAISDSMIFVTADFVWGPDEAHYVPHRYIISAYVEKTSTLLNEARYFLEGQYMTARKYDLSDEKTGILASENQEITTRLRRIKALPAGQKK